MFTEPMISLSVPGQGYETKLIMPEM